MVNRRASHIHIKLDRKQLIGASALALLCALALSLSSQNITLTTSYPAPSGVYAQVITTGGDPLNPQNTLLARDRGLVGIGTGGAAPQALLDVNGGAIIRGALGVGVAPPQYPLDVVGNAAIRGSRTILKGVDGANFHWIMAGGTTDSPVPPSDDALGFDTANRVIKPGPGWTLTGAAAKLQTGTFIGSGFSYDTTVPTPGMTPVDAMCATNQLGRAGSYCHPSCTFDFGPNSVNFHIRTPDQGCCLGWCGLPGYIYSYLIIGQ